MTKIDKLSEFEELFCVEFAKDFNATQAYIRARKNPKLKASSAAVEACKLLKKPKIVAKIRTLMEKRVERVQIEGDEVLKELSRIGYSDLRALYELDGTIKHPKDWPEELARAVASIEVDEIEEWDNERKEKVFIGYTKKIKFWPKTHALELMGKHKKLFTEKVEHSGTLTLADIVAGSESEEPHGQ
jgi:phage terminase small subunit